MEPEFKNLQFLTEAVIDKRGFFYHGDQLGPQRFIQVLHDKEYDNTSSLYGTGMYCTRHLIDALDNHYGPYVYKLYVRGLDNFLHLDEAPYNSAHGINGGLLDAEDGKVASYKMGLAYKDVKGLKGGESYADFILRQFVRLADRKVSDWDLKAMRDLIEAEADHEDGSNVVYSSDFFKYLNEYAVKYGISGVTYTGRHDRRCALVYDFNNVFPVAWLDKKELGDSWWKEEGLPQMYGQPYPKKYSGMLARWSGDKNVSYENSVANVPGGGGKPGPERINRLKLKRMTEGVYAQISDIVRNIGRNYGPSEKDFSKAKSLIVHLLLKMASLMDSLDTVTNGNSLLDRRKHWIRGYLACGDIKKTIAQLALGRKKVLSRGNGETHYRYDFDDVRTFILRIDEELGTMRSLDAVKRGTSAWDDECSKYFVYDTVNMADNMASALYAFYTWEEKAKEDAKAGNYNSFSTEDAKRAIAIMEERVDGLEKHYGGFDVEGWTGDILKVLSAPIIKAGRTCVEAMKAILSSYNGVA